MGAMLFSFFRRRPKLPPLTPEQDAFMTAALKEYNESLARLNENWRFTECSQWGFDQDQARFVLVRKDGSHVEAEGQLYGSFTSKENTWEWAWANDKIAEAARRDAFLTKAFGEKLKLEYLTRPKLPALDRDFAAFLAAAAAKVSGAQGVFAASAGKLSIYIGLKNLREGKR